MGSFVTVTCKSWEKVPSSGSYLKFRVQNLGYLSPMGLQQEFQKQILGQSPPASWYGSTPLFHPSPTNFGAKLKVVLLPTVLLLIQAYLSIQNWMKLLNFERANPNLWSKISGIAGFGSIILGWESIFFNIRLFRNTNNKLSNIVVVCVS